MAIKEKYDGLRMGGDAKKREYWCTYLVDGVVSILQFPSTFRWTCKGIADPFARLVGFSASRQIGPNKFEAEMHYSTFVEDYTQPSSNVDQPENPLARDVVRSWGTGYIEMTSPTDLSTPAKPVCASNGEPYAGGLTIKVPYLIRRYRRNESSFPEATALECIWATNSTKKILCTRFEGGEEQTDNATGIKFVPVSYEFWCLGSGDIKWEKRKLDAGSFWLEYDEGTETYTKKYPKAGAANVFSEEGVFLNGSGGRLVESDGPLPAGTVPEWNTFQEFSIASLGSLGLVGIS